jgi:hypothetical protein
MFSADPMSGPYSNNLDIVKTLPFCVLENKCLLCPHLMSQCYLYRSMPSPENNYAFAMDTTTYGLRPRTKSTRCIFLVECFIVNWSFDHSDRSSRGSHESWQSQPWIVRSSSTAGQSIKHEHEHIQSTIQLSSPITSHMDNTANNIQSPQ